MDTAQLAWRYPIDIAVYRYRYDIDMLGDICYRCSRLWWQLSNAARSLVRERVCVWQVIEAEADSLQATRADAPGQHWVGSSRQTPFCWVRVGFGIGAWL
eukprot:1275881-Pyramimonas_sp.AAC.1